MGFDFRHKDNSGFGLAQHINGLTDIEHHQLNVLDLDSGRFGTFDVVLALGLLYHTADPYRALSNCASLSRHRLLVESYCIDASIEATLRAQPVMRFLPDAARFPDAEETRGDRSNFWGFTAVCLERMIEDLDFRVTRTETWSDRVLLDCERVPADPAASRAWIAYGTVPVQPAGADRDDPAAWSIY